MTFTFIVSRESQTAKEKDDPFTEASIQDMMSQMLETSRNWEKYEGVLLRALPYLGHRRILKVFTSAGLFTFMAPSTGKWQAVTSPFCTAEWVFKASNQEIHSLKDASLLDPLLWIRGSYDCLSKAGEIAGDLLRSQLPKAATQSLYDLLLACLRHLPGHPEAIAQLFRLKLLQIEGLLHLTPECAKCGAPATQLQGGESVCNQHASALLFDAQEWQHLMTLGLARRFSEATSLQISPILAQKTALLLKERFSH